MKSQNDSPGVYMPPPLIYIAAFVAAVLIQKYLPLTQDFFHLLVSKFLGWAIMVIGLFFSFPALRQFLRTKNTLVTVRPANTLQTTGIYSISRNPMYLSLMLFYIGLSFIIGNWWNFILLPVLFLVVQQYIIKREEQYLDRRFEQQYRDYSVKVRRWF